MPVASCHCGAINARMLDLADTDGARIRRFDGPATFTYPDEADDAEP
jgi:hypothetical protein